MDKNSFAKLSMEGKVAVVTGGTQGLGGPGNKDVEVLFVQADLAKITGV